MLGVLNPQYSLIATTGCFSLATVPLQPSWLAVDFDNWRDWDQEEDDGRAEYEQYMDVSVTSVSPQVLYTQAPYFKNLCLLCLV